MDCKYMWVLALQRVAPQTQGHHMVTSKFYPSRVTDHVEKGKKT